MWRVLARVEQWLFRGGFQRNSIKFGDIKLRIPSEAQQREARIGTYENKFNGSGPSPFMGIVELSSSSSYYLLCLNTHNSDDSSRPLPQFFCLLQTHHREEQRQVKIVDMMMLKTANDSHVNGRASLVFVPPHDKKRSGGIENWYSFVTFFCRICTSEWRQSYRYRIVEFHAAFGVFSVVVSNCKTKNVNDDISIILFGYF